MVTYNDYGIILNSYSFGEKDKILSIYTKTNGLVRAIAKGVKKVTSKFSGKLDKLSCCFFHFAKGKNLDIIAELEQVNSFPLLRTDLNKLTHGILFLEIVNSFAYEKEGESNEVYELLYSSLDKLQKIEDLLIFTVKFVLDFLLIHGYKPQLDNCVSCSSPHQRRGSLASLRGRSGPKAAVLPAKSGSSPVLYSTTLGGILCNECAKLVEHIKVNASVIEIINEGSKEVRKQGSKEEDVRTALNLLREHLDIRAKNKIKSFDLAFSL